MAIGKIHDLETSQKINEIQKEIDSITIKPRKKTCITCKNVRELSEYYKGRNVCKICVIEHYKGYYKTTSKPKYTKGGEYYKYVSKKKIQKSPKIQNNNIINLLQS